MFSKTELSRAKAIGALAFTNPFLPERIAIERRILGRSFVVDRKIWSLDLDLEGARPNVEALRVLAEKLSEKARQSLITKSRASKEELQVYIDLVLYTIYYRYVDAFKDLIRAIEVGKEEPDQAALFKKFKDELSYFLDYPGIDRSRIESPEYLFALFFQSRRAFHFTYGRILGASMAAGKIRANVWQSTFTYDLGRYRRGLYKHMQDIPVLIQGASGTGKELVASAIGLSRFMPFDRKRNRFRENFRAQFQPIHLAALTPTLIESELFGHKKGAFTGAIAERKGYFDNSNLAYTVLLDEIGEVDESIQVKLLRVLQTREFQPLGDTQMRRFEGKVIAATNRDLAQEIREGRFRQDLYYRLCADIIHTPTLVKENCKSPPLILSLDWKTSGLLRFVRNRCL